MSLALSVSILFISLLQLINGAQFLNVTPSFLSSSSLPGASYLAPVVIIFPLTTIYALL